MSNYINLFNKNLESLLTNIIENFSETKENINQKYTFPIKSDSYVQTFIQTNKVKGMDISNKNEIIFSKGLVVVKDIDFNYIWNHKNMTRINKDIIWKYIQSLYLYSLEYTENINFKHILRTYNETKVIDNDTTRIVVNIFNNLSNKKVDHSESSLVELEESESSSFKMPDLSSFIGRNLMDFINKIVNSIDLNEVELNNPLELIQLLFSGDFELQKDTSGISLLVKNIIDNLKTELLSESLDRKSLFKDIEKVLLLVNNFTNNSYDFKNIIPDIDDAQFNENFNKIINSLDFESIMITMVEKIKEVKENSNIDIAKLLEQVIHDYTNNNLDMVSLMGTLMKLVSGLQPQSTTNSEQSKASDTSNATNDSSTDLNEAFKMFNSLDLGNVMKSVMGGLDNNKDNNKDDDKNNLDLNDIIKSVTDNLPSELTNNLPKDLSSQINNSLGGSDMSSIINNLSSLMEGNDLSSLLNNNNLDEIKKLIPSAKNKKINTSKINQLSRLEKRRELLRKKLEQRKQSLNLN